MTILKAFVVGMFKGHKSNGEVEQVQAAAVEQADLLVDAYADAFEQRVEERLRQRHRRFLGYDEAIDVEFTVEPETAAEQKQTLPTPRRSRARR